MQKKSLKKKEREENKVFKHIFLSVTDKHTFTFSYFHLFLSSFTVCLGSCQQFGCFLLSHFLYDLLHDLLLIIYHNY